MRRFLTRSLRADDGVDLTRKPAAAVDVVEHFGGGKAYVVEALQYADAEPIVTRSRPASRRPAPSCEGWRSQS